MYIIIIILAVIVVVGWLAYEMLMAPLMPDDYDVKDIYKQKESFPQAEEDEIKNKWKNGRSENDPVTLWNNTKQKKK